MQSVLKPSDYVEFLFRLKFGGGEPLSACSKIEDDIVLRKGDRQKPLSCAPRRASRGCGANRAGEPTRTVVAAIG